MQIRVLGVADALAYRSLRLTGLREDPAAFGPSYDESAAVPAEQTTLCRPGAPDDFALGAFDGEVLVGIVRLERERYAKRSHRAVLRGMYVRREARGRGVARALCQALIDRARQILGLARINLTVMADNTAAVGLYRSLGFEVWGKEPDAMRLLGEAHAEFSMGLVLSPWTR